MADSGNNSYRISFTSDSSPANGLHIHASFNGGPSHLFQIDTGSVGIVVPRAIIGPPYNVPDPSLPEVKLVYTSDDKPFYGQWIKMPIVLGVPPDWDHTGDYPTAAIEVFAVDQPA